jgi:hypothetical protein
MEGFSFSKIVEDILREREIIDEGIDFDTESLTVSYNPSHENNVDTSVENNPTCDGEILGGIHVWSIFKRKKNKMDFTDKDGNPLVFALKGERGWHFRSEKDREEIERQFDFIAEKFASIYKVGVTILIPSSNPLNKHIADVVMSKSENSKLLEGVVSKMTIEEIDDIVLDPNSEFRKHYDKNFKQAYARFIRFINVMKEKHNGMFAKHFVKDPEMRRVLNNTLKLSNDAYANFANDINGHDLLIIDDTISQGASIRETINIINETYSPNSVTILTMFSKLYDE